MTPRQHEKGLQEIINRVVSAIDSITASRQSGVLKRLKGLLNDPKFTFDLRSDGTIRPTGRNIRKANIILARLRPFLQTEQYRNVVQQFAKVFDRIESFNGTWFASIIPEFFQKPVYRDIKESLIEDTIVTLDPEGFKEALEKPIRDVLKSFVQSGASYTDMLAELERGLLGVKNREGDKVLRGYLDNYHWRRRLTRDTVMTYSRTYDDVVSQDLGLEWYLYSSGTVEDSRDFCIEREGRYFHINEILSWADETWQGKARGTTRQNIKTLLGGYSCMHSLRPVSLRLVPDSAIDRAKRLGFIE